MTHLLLLLLLLTLEALSYDLNRLLIHDETASWVG